MIDRVLFGAERWAVVHGDNLDVMRSMPPASVHLCYMDPGYFKGRDFKLADGRVAFSDKWPSFDAYMAHVMDRCAAARDLLTDDGCLVLHVDPDASHYLKVALDGLFGRDCFRNEIIWRYRRWPTQSKDFQRMHDVLLRYTRSPDKERFNVLYEPLSPRTVAIHGTKKQKHAITEKGRKWGKWTGNGTEESPGAYMSDVWDISVIAPLSRERTGWPTQKPRELIDRITLSLSSPSDLLLEAYAGSAPLCSSAADHDRRCISIDSSSIAVEIATARLRAEDEARRIAAEKHRRATAQMSLGIAGDAERE